MKTVTPFASGVLVTGSSGFIGSALCRQMAGSEPAVCIPADVANLADVQQVGYACNEVHTVAHLAATGTVLAGRESLARMFSCAVDGSINLIEVFRPKRFLFVSSCAVYGNTPLEGVPATWRDVNPISSYGISKIAAELLVCQWAKETGNVAIVLRCGNVIGEGCRGLIDYLVRHAVQHAKTGKPAQLRGSGRIVRDYVPVDFVVQVLMAAANAPFAPGAARVFNVGTGRGLTNRFVAETVAATLREHGYPIDIEWQEKPARGEAWTAVLDPKRTQTRFNLSSPPHEEIVCVIKASAEDALKRALAIPSTPSRERQVALAAPEY